MPWRWFLPNGKPFKSRSYLPFTFAIDKILVTIRLAEDGKRMGDT